MHSILDLTDEQIAEAKRKWKREYDASIRQITGDLLNQLAGNNMQLSLLHPDAGVSAEAFGRAQTLTYQATLAYAGMPYGRIGT